MDYRDEVYQKFKQEFLCIKQPASPQLGDNDKEADGAAAGMDREPSCSNGPLVRIVAPAHSQLRRDRAGRNTWINYVVMSLLGAVQWMLGFSR